jgi:hypothetical protein
MLKTSVTQRRVVHIYEPEAGKSLSDDEEKRLDKGLKTAKWEEESLGFQVGNGGDQLDDLIDCQVGREETPYFQVGKGEEMNSAESSYKQDELMEEDQRRILIIGGNQGIPSNSPVEARACVAYATIKRKETNNDCRRGGEGAYTDVFPTEEKEHAVNMLTPWEKELEMLEDWLNNPEPVDDCQETVMQILREEHSTKFLRNFSQEDEQMMIATLKHATEDEA